MSAAFEIQRLTGLLRVETLDFEEPASDIIEAPTAATFTHPIDSDVLRLESELDRVSQMVVTLVKATAPYTLVPRSVVWDAIRNGLGHSIYSTDFGAEIGQYMDAVELRPGSRLNHDHIRGFAKNEFEETKAALALEQRNHKILKRDMVALESSYSALVANVKSMNQTITQLEERCALHLDSKETAELKLASCEHELKVARETLDQTRDGYKMLSETYAKAAEANQKKLHQLRHALEMSQKTSMQRTDSVQEQKTDVEKELRLLNEKHDADIALLSKINDDLQTQLTRALANYTALLSSAHSEEEWISMSAKLRNAEIRAQESLTRANVATDTLQTTIQKYAVVTEEYDRSMKDLKSMRDHAARTKSILVAKDSIIDDLYAKNEVLQAENTAILAKMKSANATITAKKNLLQDYKTKLEALMSTLSPIQTAAAETQHFQDTNRRLKAEIKIKDERIRELKQRYEELDTFLKEKSASMEQQSMKLDHKMPAQIRKLRQHAAEEQMHKERLEEAVVKCFEYIIDGYLGKSKRGGEWRPVKPATGPVSNLDERMNELSHQFFGMEVEDICLHALPSLDVVKGSVAEIMKRSDVNEALPKLLKSILKKHTSRRDYCTPIL
ncbi:hypothetical protein CcCBS67573_g03556 [Chytriomyces confervae]|uniref:Uncharacterized protein n=1 Tax=Chytriomyces confervae TaxID=246404 RepID=A0A507FFN3_9FUNG|nr:hypothetical protein CcCBS67573_g03556 [Chytriomyces confervae]